MTDTGSSTLSRGKRGPDVLRAAVFIMLTAVAITANWFFLYTHAPNGTLMYHSVSNFGSGDLVVSPDELDRQIAAIGGGRTVFLTDRGDGVALTFDDGYSDFYDEVYPLLKKHVAVATVFIPSSFIGTEGYLTAGQLREMSDSGYVSVQSHAVTHRRLTTLDDETLERELRDSAAEITAITGKEVYAIAYPFGDYDSRVLAAASRYYTVGVTTRAPRRIDAANPLAIPRTGVPGGCTPERFREFLPEDIKQP